MGLRKTPLNLVQKKKENWEETKKSCCEVTSDHLWNPPSDEIYTRTDKLARPMLRPDLRTFHKEQLYTRSVKKFGRNLDPKAEIREPFENSKRTSDTLNSSGS